MPPTYEETGQCMNYRDTLWQVPSVAWKPKGQPFELENGYTLPILAISHPHFFILLRPNRFAQLAPSGHGPSKQYEYHRLPLLLFKPNTGYEPLSAL